MFFDCIVNVRISYWNYVQVRVNKIVKFSYVFSYKKGDVEYCILQETFRVLNVISKNTPPTRIPPLPRKAPLPVLIHKSELLEYQRSEQFVNDIVYLVFQKYDL